MKKQKSISKNLLNDNKLLYKLARSHIIPLGNKARLLKSEIIDSHTFKVIFLDREGIKEEQFIESSPFVFSIHVNKKRKLLKSVQTNECSGSAPSTKKGDQK